MDFDGLAYNWVRIKESKKDRKVFVKHLGTKYESCHARKYKATPFVLRYNNLLPLLFSTVDVRNKRDRIKELHQITSIPLNPDLTGGCPRGVMV